MIGQTLNRRYRITSLLGEGGMGEVYLATDKQTRQPVAVKILARQLSMNPESLERFRREAETLRKLDHPNIVKFVDAFEYQKQYVIVMEYMPGGGLFQLLKVGSLPIERARQITLDLCDALIRAHRLNIIHRDIKPENILIDRDGTPKLADFGVARLSEFTRMTRSGTQVGTPYYMAPEAWEGKTLDAQADIWSLGVMLFEMLSGEVPFGGDTGAAVMTKVLTTEPPDLKNLRPEMPEELVRIVRRMLTRDKEQRFQSMREVALELERVTVAPVQTGSEKEIIGLREEQVRTDAHEGLSVHGYATEQSMPVEITKEKATHALPDWRRTVSNSNLRLIVGFVGGLLIIGLLIWGGSKILQNLPAATPGSTPIFQTDVTFTTQPSKTVTSQPELTNTPSLTEPSIPSTPALDIGSTMISDKDGMTLRYVPSGEFIMGSDDAGSNEKPLHTVSLDAFWIDQTEVTNAMYETCINSGACKLPSSKSQQKRSSYYGNAQYADYPVVYVSWDDAQTYCAWANRRLPSEAEWEKAARGTDGRAYPWGWGANRDLLNFDVGGRGLITTEVGTYPSGASPYGALDMAGNAWEWVADWYDSLYYQSSPSNNPSGPAYGDFRVVRGAAWGEPDLFAINARVAYRSKSNPLLASDYLGFRCAMSATR